MLQHVEDGELMPPLMVIQALADSQFATLSDIKVMVELEVLCVCVHALTDRERGGREGRSGLVNVVCISTAIHCEASPERERADRQGNDVGPCDVE